MRQSVAMERIPIHTILFIFILHTTNRKCWTFMLESSSISRKHHEYCTARSYSRDHSFKSKPDSMMHSAAIKWFLMSHNPLVKYIGKYALYIPFHYYGPYISLIIPILIKWRLEPFQYKDAVVTINEFQSQRKDVYENAFFSCYIVNTMCQEINIHG